MAGARIEVDADTRAVRQALQGLVEASINLRQPLEEIGSALRSSTEERFEDEEDPEGSPWAELKEATQQQLVTKRRRRGDEHILRRQGYLYASLTYAARQTEVEVGTNRIYGAIHQLGGEPDMPPGPAAVPARPFLGMSDQDEREIGDILERHLNRGLT